jgi:hypothetical protein
MIWPEGSIWAEHDRLPVPHNDTALEWMCDLLLEEPIQPAPKRRTVRPDLSERKAA